MANKDKSKESQFLTGQIVKRILEAKVLDEEMVRRGFAEALGVDPNLGTSQSSCHVARALIDAGVIRTKPGK
jgi:hypothetical protein